MHVAAPLHDAQGRIIGVLTVAKANSTIAPVIARSQAVVLRWGALLLGVALLVGLIAAWWLSRQVGTLRRYAYAVTAGERASLPRTAGEFDELGRALETMRDRLEGKQYVEQYVHALTHEMKSPLAAIGSSAELLEDTHGDRPMAEADRTRFAASIRLQSERLAQMIDKLLALAGVEHRQRLDNPEPIDPVDLVQAASEQCRLRVARGGMNLLTDVPQDLPQLRGDAFLLRQALVNLIENAVDFSPAGSDITLRVRREASSVRFEIVDRGVGVPEYALPRVFERFYSLPRPGGGSRSSGLGLCFVAEVATLHGGRATVVNCDGGGAMASLLLPL
jgi:two-component system sensor histidine kinase CreC